MKSIKKYQFIQKKSAAGFVLLLILSILTYFSADVSAYSDFQYSVRSDSSISITGYTGTKDSVVIPKYIDGKAVNAVSDRAFSGNTKIRLFNLSENVTYLGENVFESCSSLETIYILGNIGTLSSSTFKNCKKLDYVHIKGWCETIGSSAFSGCSNLTSVCIPASLKHIKSDAFKDCGKLSDVLFAGTEAQWKNIVIEDGNDVLSKAAITINFGSTDPNDPQHTLSSSPPVEEPESISEKVSSQPDESSLEDPDVTFYAESEYSIDNVNKKESSAQYSSDAQNGIVKIDESVVPYTKQNSRNIGMVVFCVLAGIFVFVSAIMVIAKLDS